MLYAFLCTAFLINKLSNTVHPKGKETIRVFNALTIMFKIIIVLFRALAVASRFGKGNERNIEDFVEEMLQSQ